jgi:hypothetical protein
MRTIGKLASLVLIIALAPLLSACSKAEAEAWSGRLYTTLWPHAKPPQPLPKSKVDDPGPKKPSAHRQRHRAEHARAGTRYCANAVEHRRGQAQPRKARESRFGRRSRTAFIDVQQSGTGAAQVEQITHRGMIGLHGTLWPTPYA